MKIVGLTIGFLLFVFQVGTYAQSYRGIFPGKSTCRDVERILNIKACGSSNVVYKSEEKDITFFVLQERCERLFQTQWNLPKNTIIGVIVSYKEPFPVGEFPLDLSKFEKTSGDAETYFANADKSISLSVSNDFLRSVWYLPSRADRTLVCLKHRKGASPRFALR